MSQRIVITGANRGLGLEFTRRYLDRGDTVFALARRPDQAKELQELQAKHGDSLTLIATDVADEASVERAASQIRETTDGIDLLINNAGVNSQSASTFMDSKIEDVVDVLQVNLFGPWRMSRALVDVVRAGQSPKIVQISSLMGSIGDDDSGGSWAYRISKTAVNMFNRNLAHELPDVVVVALHPGWVQTDMGGSAAPLSIPESVGAMVETIDRLTADHSGRFFDRHGEALPY